MKYSKSDNTRSNSEDFFKMDNYFEGKNLKSEFSNDEITFTSKLNANFKTKMLYTKSSLNNACEIGKYVYGVVEKKSNFFNRCYKYKIGQSMGDYIPVLYAEKELFGYTIYKNLPNESREIVGKIKNNFNGTKYILNENKKETVAVEFKKTCPNTKIPRKIVVYYDGVGNTDSENLSSRIKNRKYEEIVILNNKPPILCEQMNSFVLDFGGRVKIASEKNFILVHSKQMSYNLLKFGKLDKLSYSCDYSFPFNSIQAFFLAICSLDTKILPNINLPCFVQF